MRIGCLLVDPDWRVEELFLFVIFDSLVPKQKEFLSRNSSLFFGSAPFLFSPSGEEEGVRKEKVERARRNSGTVI